MPEILLNPDKAPVPEEPSARIAVATALGRVLTDHSIAKGMVYLNRLPTEMRVLSMRDAAVRDRAITHTPELSNSALNMRSYVVFKVMSRSSVNAQ